MKKMLALSLLVSSLAFAGHEEGSRWGVGLRAGVAAFAGKLDQRLRLFVAETDDATGNDLNNAYSQCNKFYPGYTSFQGGAFLEFGYRSCDWSFGALIDVNGDTLKKTYAYQLGTPYVESFDAGFDNLTGATESDATNLLQSRIQAPLHVGGDIRGGMYFGDALWYALIGVEGIKIRHSSYAAINSLVFAQNDAIAVADNSTFYSITDLDDTLVIGNRYANNNCNTSCNVSNSCNTACNTNNNCFTDCNSNNYCNNFWRAALRVGTGIEYNWSDCFNVKLEYRFLWAGKKCLTTLACAPQEATYAKVSSNSANPRVWSVDTDDVYVSGDIRDTVYFRQHVTALMFSYMF